MRLLWKLVLPAGLGLLFAYVSGFSPLEHSSTYGTLTSALLAIGLYGSTYGLDLVEARRHSTMILAAVTIGVMLKAALIGVSLALAAQDPLFILLGVVVAQIDPLSVAEIMDHPRMSNRAKSILAAWASFDDPIVTILVLFIVPIVMWMKRMPLSEADFQMSPIGSIWPTALFVIVALAAWILVRRWQVAQVGLVLAMIVVTIWQFTMLGLAIAGLFVRPRISTYVYWSVQLALTGAAFMLGLLLTSGVNLIAGVLLGVATFVAQIIVSVPLTRRLSMMDRIHLAFAQQNGITAITLALLLEPQFPGVVGIVAPAILTINLIHVLSNRLVDNRFPRPSG